MNHGNSPREALGSSRALGRLLLLLVLGLSLPDAAAEPSGFMETPFPPADGFDPPPARARRATALGHGRVLRAEQGRVEVEHVYYEGAEQRRLRSSYEPLIEIAVRSGQLVKRGQRLGKGGAGLEITLRPGDGSPPDRRGGSSAAVVLPGGPAPPATGPSASPRPIAPAKAFVPQAEPFVVVVSQDQNLLETYAYGALQQRFEVGFGQAEGQKRLQGDLKTPRGMYFVIAKSQGPFSGLYGAYYGGHWIKLNYPSAADAAWGLDNGVITAETARQIERDWAARRSTAQGTKLGGGIGFHGWASEWSLADDGGRLSWGCVVLHLRDIAAFYAQVPLGAMVILR